MRALKPNGLFRCAPGGARRRRPRRRPCRIAAMRSMDVRPVYKRIDTCAAEFASPTAYMYSAYEGDGVHRRRNARRDPSDRQEGHHPGRRPEPDRPGHRVRLLLLSTPPSRWPRPGYRDHHGQLQPGDRLDRLRHLRPALLRAADRRRRARIAARSRPTARLQGVIVQFGGQTPLKLARRAGRRPASRSWAPRRTPSIWPKTATGSRRCCTTGTAPAGQRHRHTSARPSAQDCRARSAIRWSSGRPTCWAAGPWRSSTMTRRWSATSTTAVRGVRRQPGADRQLPADAIEVDVDALATARTSTSPASWSISRRPASTPATAPARCRPIRWTTPPSRRSAEQTETLAKGLNVRSDERAVRDQGLR